MLRSAATRWVSLEPEAALARVLSAAAESAASDEEATAGPSTPTVGRGAPAEYHVGGGLHERHALWRPSIPDAEHPR